MSDQNKTEASVGHQGKIETLAKLIDNERGSIKWSLISAIGLFAIGLIISTFIYYLGNEEAGKSQTEALSKYVLGIPPLITTLLTGFPIKEYFAKKNRITSCQFLQIAYQSHPVPEEIEKRFWMLMDKSLT